MSYMCVETGVGSGSIWYERYLFPSEAEAQADADRRAVIEMQKVMESPRGKQLAEIRDLSTYQLKDALVKEAENRAWEAGYSLRRIVERIHGLLDEDGSGTYLMSSGFDEDAEEGKYPNSGRLELKPELIRLLQDHLVSYDERASAMLREHRAADKECKC